MRRLLPVLILITAMTLPAGAGELDSGGGTRTDGQITVHDALGAPLAGFSQATGVRAASGSQFGYGFPTPVMLTALEIGALAEGVSLRWAGSDDRGISLFRLQRAVGDGGAPDDERYEDLAAFDGPGPHEYLDRDVTGGTAYRYRLQARLRTGAEETLGPWTVTAVGDARPVRTTVLAASPNPFREAFSLSYSLVEPAPVRWRILDVRGALVEEGDLGFRPAGTHTAALRPPARLPRGIYFLEVRAGSVRNVQKVVKLP